MESANNKPEETKVTSNAGPTGLGVASAVPTPAEAKTEETKVEETKTDETKVDETKVEEEKKEEETKTEPTFTAPVKAEDTVNAYAVYNERGFIAKMFQRGPHGENFAELAVKFAERKGNGWTAKPYLPTVDIETVDVDTVHIVNVNDEPIRTFSLKVHGKEYKKLAAQFLEKYAVKKGYKIKK